MSEGPKPTYGVAREPWESGEWGHDRPEAFTIEQWLDRFRQNASLTDGSPRIVHRVRQAADRTAEAFPFVQGETSGEAEKDSEAG